MRVDVVTRAGPGLIFDTPDAGRDALAPPVTGRRARPFKLAEARTETFQGRGRQFLSARAQSQRHQKQGLALRLGTKRFAQTATKAPRPMSLTAPTKPVVAAVGFPGRISAIDLADPKQATLATPPESVLPLRQARPAPGPHSSIVTPAQRVSHGQALGPLLRAC